MEKAASSQNRWLFGPAPDLLLGCGLLYTLLFGAYAAAGPTLRAYTPDALFPLLILLLSSPHYGGTLLRVYEQRQERRSYAIFSVWTTLALLGLFALTLRDPFLGSVAFTLYLTWSPWHYSGQNYGLAVMFLRRRGVEVTPRAKSWLHACFTLSFLIAGLVMHLEVGTAYSPLAYVGQQVTFLPIGISRGFGDIALPLVGLAYLVSVVVSLVLLKANSRWSDLLPTLLLILTQALWFAAPYSVQYWGVATGLEPLDAQRQIAIYTMMIFIGHGVQYLWVTTYYARAGRVWHGYANYWGKAAAAGISIWVLPVALIAPTGLAAGVGSVGSLALLVATFVNLHHFILDGAIWKLRQSRVAGVLIRPVEPDAPGSADTGMPWLRRAVWSVAGIGLVVGVVGEVTRVAVLPPALNRGDYDFAGRAIDFIAPLGADEPFVRKSLVKGLLREGDTEAALHHARRLIALDAKADTYQLLARVETRIGDHEAARQTLVRALDAGARDPERVHGRLARLALQSDDEASAVRHYRAALALKPSPSLSNDFAWLLATARDSAVRDPQTSLALAQVVVRFEETPNHLDTLAAAYAAAGRWEDAVDTASRAEALAEQSGNKALLDEIRARLAGYRAASR